MCVVRARLFTDTCVRDRVFPVVFGFPNFLGGWRGFHNDDIQNHMKAFSHLIQCIEMSE